MKNRFLAIVLAALLIGPIVVNATPILTALGGDSYQVSFDALTFNVTTTGEFASVVFENFYSAVQPSCGNYVSGSVQASLNGGASVALIGNSCTGAYDSLNAVDGDDLLITVYVGVLNTFGGVTVGDTITLSTVDYVFNLPGLNPTANASPFDAFMVNNSFELISDIVSTSSPVSEPATLALFGLGLFGFGCRQRRKLG